MDVGKFVCNADAKEMNKVKADQNRNKMCVTLT